MVPYQYRPEMVTGSQCITAAFQNFRRYTFGKASVSLALWLVLASCPAFAEYWEVSYPVNLGAVYDDNAELVVSGVEKESSTKIFLVPGVVATRETERSMLNLNVSVSVERFVDTESALDRNDPALEVGYLYRFQRSEMELNVSARRQATSVSEFEDTGLTLIDESREDLKLDASYRFEIDETTTASIQGRLQQVSYSTDLLDDNESQSLDLALNRVLTERLDATLGATGYFFRPSGEETIASDAYAVNVGMAYQWSPRFQTRALARATILDREGIGTDQGWLWELSLDYDTASETSFTLNAQRELSPSGAGELRLSDSIQFGVRHGLTEYLSAGAGASWRKSEGDSVDLLQVDATEQVQFEPWVTWEVSEFAGLRGSYRYRRQKRGVESQWAESNSVLVSLNLKF